jgi:hypothetical protein
MRTPEVRKPAAYLARTGLQEMSRLAADDVLENNCNPVYFQAKRLQSRFAMSWPLASVVADLAYGRAPA